MVGVALTRTSSATGAIGAGVGLLCDLVAGVTEPAAAPGRGTHGLAPIAASADGRLVASPFLGLRLSKVANYFCDVVELPVVFDPVAGRARLAERVLARIRIQKSHCVSSRATHGLLVETFDSRRKCRTIGRALATLIVAGSTWPYRARRSLVFFLVGRPLFRRTTRVASGAGPSAAA